MTKSIAEKSKKRGRPATGKDPLVGVRIRPALVAQIDRVGRRHPSDALRIDVGGLIEEALAKGSTPCRTSRFLTGATIQAAST